MLGLHALHVRSGRLSLGLKVSRVLELSEKWKYKVLAREFCASVRLEQIRRGLQEKQSRKCKSLAALERTAYNEDGGGSGMLPWHSSLHKNKCDVHTAGVLPEGDRKAVTESLEMTRPAHLFTAS